MRKPPQVVKSSTLPDSHGSGSRGAKARRSSEEFRDSLERQGGIIFITVYDLAVKALTRLCKCID